MKIDRFVKTTLVVIAVLLALNCATNLHSPADAQSTSIKFGHANFQGDISLPGGRIGKAVVDLRNGNAWGFPVNSLSNDQPLDVAPIYLGRFKLEAMDNVPDQK